MTSADVTLSGVPSRRLYRHVSTSNFSARYEEAEFTRYLLTIPAPAPLELRVTLELGQEDGGVWAHIPEFDVSSEGGNLLEAFGNVMVAARDWLSYLREGDAELAPELAEQGRYIPLLDAPVFSWFKDFRFVE